MLQLSDPRWGQLRSGYRQLCDPRPALEALESGSSEAWSELWEQLHHQGDVDTAAYAAVPQLVRIYLSLQVPDWNAYALVGIIALAKDSNPPIPEWLAPGFGAAIRDLSEYGSREVLRVTDPVLVQSALGIIALDRGLANTARLLLSYDEAELGDLEL